MLMMLFSRVVLVVTVGYVVAIPIDSTTTTISPDTAIREECRNKESDIYFLLDSSSSVMRRDFQQLLNFVESFVEKLDIAPHATRVGLGVFANNFYHQFDIGKYNNKSSLVEAIRNVRYYGGGSYTGKGLLGMRTRGFGSARKNATKIGVVITDGRSRHRTNTLLQAGRLKDQGVWLFAVGVSSEVDVGELSIFSSLPVSDFLRHVATFADLANLTDDLALSACKLQPPHADNATCGLRQKADIIFIYNAAAMNATSVTHVQNFIKDVIQTFSMTSGNVRVGVISEGRQGGDIALSQYIRREDFVEALARLPQPQLVTLLRKAREQGYDSHFGGRPNAKKFAIVFVDDVSISNDALMEARMMTTYYGITVYVIGVGVRKVGGVQQLPTSPDYFSRFLSYSRLRDATGQQKFVQNLCKSL